jgi:predicted transcriptional regulator of viral defense system
MAGSYQIPAGTGVELVRKLAAQGDHIFSTGRAREIAREVGLSADYVRQSLHHLTKSGWLVRLRKGLYAISPTVPGVTPVHEFEIAMHLVEPAAIGLWSALHWHGLTDQVPAKVFVLTTTNCPVPRARGRKARLAVGGYPVGDTIYRFIQVKPERFFGTEKVWIGDARVTITDPERTLIDGLTMPRYCGDLAEVLLAFEARRGQLDLDQIIGYARRLDKATAKRLGWVLEHVGVDPIRLEPLRQVPIKGYRTLDPSGPRRGPCNGHWMIQENLPGRVSP